jgi:hypothetical protein
MKLIYQISPLGGNGPSIGGDCDHAERAQRARTAGIRAACDAQGTCPASIGNGIFIGAPEIAPIGEFIVNP